MGCALLGFALCEVTLSHPSSLRLLIRVWASLFLEWTGKLQERSPVTESHPSKGPAREGCNPTGTRLRRRRYSAATTWLNGRYGWIQTTAAPQHLPCPLSSNMKASGAVSPTRLGIPKVQAKSIWTASRQCHLTSTLGKTIEPSLASSSLQRPLHRGVVTGTLEAQLQRPCPKWLRTRLR